MPGTKVYFSRRSLDFLLSEKILEGGRAFPLKAARVG
jgi:hypothetical protein